MQTSAPAITSPKGPRGFVAGALDWLWMANFGFAGGPTPSE